jgi:hypothetical protein
MRIKRLTLLIVILFAFIATKAQWWNQLKYEYYYGIGATNFMGDVSAPSDNTKLIWVNFFNTIGPYGNAGLRYKWKERHNFNGNLSLGQIYAKDPVGDANYQDANREANSFFIELSGRYEFVVFKEKQRRTVYRMLGENPLKNFNLPTYMFVGAGGMYNIGTYTKNDYAEVITEPIRNFAPVVMGGIGFKTRLSDLSYLNVEATIRLPFSDGIDWATNGVGNGGGGEWFDQYQTISINYVHKLKANAKGLPKFRR